MVTREKLVAEKRAVDLKLAALREFVTTCRAYHDLPIVDRAQVGKECNALSMQSRRLEAEIGAL